MNYFIFLHECIIFTNFLHPFKDCHVNIFWAKVYVVPKDNPPGKLLVLPIEWRILILFFFLFLLFHMVVHDIIFNMILKL
jgi:hypothetical protein